MRAKLLAERIDHTQLSPVAGPGEIERLCQEAITYGFGCVCVAPRWVSLARHLLAGTGKRIASVVAFPLGNILPAAKCRDTEELVALGAHEVDCVIDLAAARLGMWTELAEEMAGVVRAAAGRPVKAIVETGYLDEPTLCRTCEALLPTGIAYIKTCTGFGPSGATVEAVRLIRSVVGSSLKIKASGGIRTLKQAEELLEAGADRLGTSASVAILEELA
jgi:deoxyribose-phosphate aldolase